MANAPRARLKNPANFCSRLPASSLLSCYRRPAEAYVSEPDKVYTNAEEMPHLPGTAGLAPIAEAVQRRLVVSPRTEEGRVFVKLTVGKAGDV